PDGSIAHISNRSGFYELWTLAPGKPPTRLTNLQGSSELSPSWSRDGSRIAFVAVKGRRADIFTVARDGSQLRQLTQDGISKRDVVCTRRPNQLLYLARVDGRWRLMEVSDVDPTTAHPAPRKVQADHNSWLALHTAPDGSVFGQRETEEQIRLIDSDSG